MPEALFEETDLHSAGVSLKHTEPFPIVSIPLNCCNSCLPKNESTPEIKFCSSSEFSLMQILTRLTWEDASKPVALNLWVATPVVVKGHFHMGRKSDSLHYQICMLSFIT